MLPMYTTDCVVHFPRRETGSHQTSSHKSPTGILIELQRLNAPCSGVGRADATLGGEPIRGLNNDHHDSNSRDHGSNSDRVQGSYLRFMGSNRPVICGKLEELSLNERFYRFDMRDQVSVQFNRSPMFNLSYKLVDYCYNVSTSNETGQFYIPPSISDNLECYFRIHLPYGNRILLRIVTNNDSEILANGMSGHQQGGYDADEGDSDGGDEDEDEDLYINGGYNDDDEGDLNDGNGTTWIWTKSGKRLMPKIVNLGSRIDKLPKTQHTANGSLNQDIDSDLNSIGLDTFQFLATNWANMQIMRPNTASSAPTITTSAASSSLSSTQTALNHRCPEGILIRVFEMENRMGPNYKDNVMVCRWTYCVSDTGDMKAFILHSTGNRLNVHLLRSLPSNRQGTTNSASNDSRHKIAKPSTSSKPHQDYRSSASNFGQDQLKRVSVFITYQAESVPEVTSNCGFGWIAMQQLCVSAVEKRLTWNEAEQHCLQLNGHLVSIHNTEQQQIIDNLLVNSPGYNEQNAYWVGGSDRHYEADYRWTDGLQFQFTSEYLTRHYFFIITIIFKVILRRDISILMCNTTALGCI